MTGESKMAAYNPLRVIAAGDDRSHPAQPPVSLGGPGFGHPSDCDDAQTEWDGGPYPASEPGVYDIGERHFVVPHGEAGYLWWHDCTAVEHVSWGWFGRVSAGQESGHRIVHHAPSLTVEGSLLCTDCGDHGFIRHMRWVRA